MSLFTAVADTLREEFRNAAVSRQRDPGAQTQRLNWWTTEGPRFAHRIFASNQFQNAIVNRITNTISRDAAFVVASTLAAIDQDGNLLDYGRYERIPGVLRRSLDGGVSDAYSFLKRIFWDIARTPAALLVPGYNAAGNFAGAIRLVPPPDAQYFSGLIVAHAEGSSEPSQFSRRQVVQASYNTPTHTTQNTYSDIFPPSPIEVLQAEIDTQTMISAAWKDRLEHGPKTGFIVGMKDAPTQDTVEAAKNAGLQFAQEAIPWVIGAGVDVTQVQDDTLSQDVLNILSRLIRTTCNNWSFPIHKLGEASAAPKVDVLLAEYPNDCLRPLVNELLFPLEQRILRANPEMGVTRAMFHVSYAAFTTGTPNSEVNRAVALLDKGIGKPAEARKILGVQPLTKEELEEMEEERESRQLPEGGVPGEGGPPSPEVGQEGGTPSREEPEEQDFVTSRLLEEARERLRARL